MWLIYSSIIMLSSIILIFFLNTKIHFKRTFVYIGIFALVILFGFCEGFSIYFKEENYLKWFINVGIAYNIVLNSLLFLLCFYKVETYKEKINLKLYIPYSLLLIGGYIGLVLFGVNDILELGDTSNLIAKYTIIGINFFTGLFMLLNSFLYKHNKINLIVASFVTLFATGFQIYSFEPILSVSLSLVIFFAYFSLESGIKYYDVNEHNYNGEIFENYKQKINKNQSILYVVIEEAEADKNLVLNKFFNFNFYKVSSNLFAIILKNEKADFITQNIENFVKFSIFDQEVNIKYNAYLLNYSFLEAYSFEEKDITDYLKTLHITDEFIMHVISDEDKKAILENKKLLTMIDNAVKNDGFEIYYQPIYSTEKDKFISAEALIRFKDKETLGFVSPEIFIPLAEKKGYAEEIGRIVFRKVCSFYKEHDLTNKYNMKYIELNVSGLHITTKNIVSDFKKILEEYQLTPENINIEITETAEILNKKQMDDNLNKLRKLGFKFSMDDFGSGYSNLTNIVSNGYELIKIDKSLLWDAFKEGWKQEDSKILLETCINLGHFLHRHLVVEGVETKEMVDYLKSKNVEYLQGYYYSKPIPENDFIKFIEDNNFNQERELEASEYLINNLLK